MNGTSPDSINEESNVIPVPATAEQIREVMDDGTRIMVTFKDTSTPPEWVKVAKVPREKFPEFGSALMAGMRNGVEIPEIAILTERSEEWVKSLSEESFDMLADEGRRLNFSRFASWFSRRQEVMKMLGGTSQPAIQAAIEQIVKEQQRQQQKR